MRCASGDRERCVVGMMLDDKAYPDDATRPLADLGG